MSWQPCDDPKPGDKLACDAIETVIMPRARDLGGFEVRRALPSAQRQMVGPFIFWDQMGPAEFLLGQGMDVRPHPHIGLATVTYLFDGEVIHRDSLGTRDPDPARRPEPDERRAGASCIRSAPARRRGRSGRSSTASRAGSRCRARTRKASRPSCITARRACPCSATAACACA